MSLAELFCLIALGIQVVLGFLVIYRAPRNPGNQCFSFLLFLFSLWSGAELLIMRYGLSPLLGKLLFTPMIMLPLVFAVFSSIFPQRLEHSLVFGSRWKEVLAVLPNLYLLVRLWHGDLIDRLEPTSGGLLVSLGEFEFIVKGIVVAYLLISLKNLNFARQKTDSDLLMRRFRYTFAGLVLPASAGSIYVALGRWYFAGSTIYTFGVFPALSLIMSGMIAYAMLRYQLMEIDLLFSLGLVYTLLTIVLAGGIELLENFLQGFFHLTGTWATIFTTLFVAAFFAPLRDLIGRLVDRLFGKEAIDTTALLGKVLREMRRASSHRGVLEKLLAETQEILKFSQAVVRLADGMTVALPDNAREYPPLPPPWTSLDELEALIEEQTSDEGPAGSAFQAWKDAGFHLAFPVTGGTVFQGALFLGPKNGLLPYSQAERDLMRELAREIFPVFEVVSMVETLVEHEKDARELEWAKAMYRQIQADPARREFAGHPLRLYSSLAKTLKGDLIDLCEKPDKRFLAVFDAFHQGIQAALTLHIVHAALRAATAIDLPRLHALLHDFAEPPLRTAATLVEVPSPGVLKIANAGNPPPVWLDGLGQVALIGGTGKPLGLEPEPGIVIGERQLGRGQAVLVSTNGLAKVFGDDQGDGLLDFLRTFRGDPIDGLLPLIRGRIDGKQASGEFPDDITFVLIGGRDEPATTKNQ